MLVIRTGKPGHGKTLNTIREVDQKAHAEGRVVYYHNINGLKPDQLQAQWFEFEDPEKWFELPSDSIIVVDEAQGWFGARDPRARPPEHITRFETMRHQGHEVHLVTQDPRYLDVHLRRLCNSHIHYWRVFKSAQLLRFESEVVVEKVELKTSFKDADKKSLRLDKRYFGAYTSTNAKHHFQTKVPTKFILAMCVIIGAGILVYRAYGRYSAEKTQLESNTSAPAGSMTGCRCNTQQGTRLDVSFRFCMSVVQNGYFDDTKPDRGSPQDVRSQPPPPTTTPTYQPSQQQAASNFTRVPYEKGRFLW